MAKCKYSSIFIIYNPIATGPAPQAARDLHKKLLESAPNVSIKLVETEYKYHAIKLGQELTKDPMSLIVYTGGDGGYHELINGVMKLPVEERPIVAVNPAGNANDHHRTVIKGQDLSHLILNNKIQSIDLLRVDLTGAKVDQTIYAHSYVGIGLTGRVARSLDSDRQSGKRFVRLRQLRTIILELAANRSFSVRTADGTKVEVKNIIAANAPEMAMVLKISKHAKLTDNQFELVITPAGSRRLFLRQVTRAAVKGLTPSRSHHEYTFTILDDVDAQIDGEVYHFAANSLIMLKSQPAAIRTLLE